MDSGAPNRLYYVEMYLTKILFVVCQGTVSSIRYSTESSMTCVLDAYVLTSDMHEKLVSISIAVP